MSGYDNILAGSCVSVLPVIPVAMHSPDSSHVWYACSYGLVINNATMFKSCFLSVYHCVYTAVLPMSRIGRFILKNGKCTEQK